MTGDDAKQEQPKKQRRKKDRKLPAGVTPLLTPEQAAEYTGLSIRTINKYCGPRADLQIPHYRTPDGGIRIDLDDLKRWLSEFKNRPRRKRVKKSGPPSENRQQNRQQGPRTSAVQCVPAVCALLDTKPLSANR